MVSTVWFLNVSLMVCCSSLSVFWSTLAVASSIHSSCMAKESEWEVTLQSINSCNMNVSPFCFHSSLVVRRTAPLPKRVHKLAQEYDQYQLTAFKVTCHECKPGISGVNTPPNRVKSKLIIIENSLKCKSTPGLVLSVSLKNAFIMGGAPVQR